MSAPEPTQIDNIRLAVLRVVKDISGTRTGNVRSIEIYRHALLRLEEGKRISNALFQMKRADPALLLTDVSGNYELTAAGHAHLDRHKDVPLDREPTKPKGPEGKGERVNDPAAPRRPGRERQELKPLATRTTQLPPITEMKPGAVTYHRPEAGTVTDTSHIHKTIADLEARQVKLEEMLRVNQQAIEALKRLAQGLPI